jgi:hypothetical protein
MNNKIIIHLSSLQATDRVWFQFVCPDLFPPPGSNNEAIDNKDDYLPFFSSTESNSLDRGGNAAVNYNDAILDILSQEPITNNDKQLNPFSPPPPPSLPRPPSLSSPPIKPYAVNLLSSPLSTSSRSSGLFSSTSTLPLSPNKEQYSASTFNMDMDSTPELENSDNEEKEAEEELMIHRQCKHKRGRDSQDLDKGQNQDYTTEDQEPRVVVSFKSDQAI